MATKIDINCDMGEDFGRWKIGDAAPEELFPLISSANIAAGFHAGDPTLMDQMVRLAREHNVGIGVHPGYRDLVGFGRRRIDGTTEELLNDVIYQIGALKGFLDRHGASLQHVKPHGALYMEMASNKELAEAFISYMRQSLPEAYVFCMADTAVYEEAVSQGQPLVREFYADRHYGDDGKIVFTRNIGVLSPQDIARKVVRAALDGVVEAVSGKVVSVEFDSVCFHSDTPGCLEIARKMHSLMASNDCEMAGIGKLELGKKKVLEEVA